MAEYILSTKQGSEDGSGGSALNNYLLVIESNTNDALVYPLGSAIVGAKQSSDNYSFTLIHPSLGKLILYIYEIVSVNSTTPARTDYEADLELIISAMP